MELAVVEKDGVFKKLSRIFWIFIIGSILGFILETIVAFVQNGHYVTRQGLLFGPFIQVYGFGLVIYYLIVPHAKTNTQIFFTSFILGGVVEYLFSYFQEKYFGTVSWDYSDLLFNINGRTSLLHCIYWGIGGLAFMKLIYPHISNLDKIYKSTYFKAVTVFLVVFMTFNISFTSLASQRQLERRNNIVAQGKLDKFLDTYYPDSKLEEIYSNAEER